MRPGPRPACECGPLGIRRRVTGRARFAESWPVELNPGRFRSDEAWLRVLERTASILGDLEAVIRRELGTDQIAPKTCG